MLQGKKKLLYMFLSTFIVLTGIFTVRDSEMKKADDFPYGKYVYEIIEVFKDSSDGSVFSFDIKK